MTDKDPILLFDGVCKLCNNSVHFILKHNRKENIRFSSLQSEFARQQLKLFGLTSESMQSLVFLENGKAYTKSDAALNVSKHLNGFWRLGYLFLVVPRPIRNAVYDLIAKHRYKWFGKGDTCWIPQPKWENRFLDYTSR